MVVLAIVWILFVLALAGATVLAWITNAIYVFHSFGAAITPEVLIAIAGTVLAPLGSLHGVYLWFH